jgi:hypothetical protein
MNIQTVNLLAEETIKDIIMRGLRKLADKRGSKVSDPSRLYPSSLHCVERKGVLQSLTNTRGGRSSKAGTLYFMGEIGQKVHEILQDAINEDEKAVFFEFHTQNIKNANIGGYLDGLVIVGGKLYVLEIKSCQSLPPKVKKPHDKQTDFYSAYCGLPILMIYQVNNGQTKMYLDEDELEMSFFIKEYDEENAFNIMKQIFLTKILQEAQIVPPIPPKFSENQCKNVYRCKLFYHCRSDRFLVPQVVPESLEELAEKRAEKFINDMPQRRNGSLRHCVNVNRNAAKLLKNRNWEDLF